jgi:hypothetical protein
LKLRLLAVVALGVALPLLAPKPALAARIYVNIAPPEPVVEVVTVAPSDRHIWIAGYHRWDGRAYIWVPGHYAVPPRHRTTWVRGHWVRHQRGWYWVDGRWR